MYERFKNLGHEVCHCLRWKSMFYQAEPDPTVPPSNDDNYWCVMTQVCLGPDGKLADPQSCNPKRTCYDVIE